MVRSFFSQAPSRHFLALIVFLRNDSTLRVGVSFTDPDDDQHTMTVSWADSSPDTVVVLSEGARPCSNRHAVAVTIA